MRKIRSQLVMICFLSSIGLLSNCFYYSNESQFYNEDNFLRSNTKLNSLNSSSWCRTLAVNTVGERIVTDSSNNVYIVGRFYLHSDDPFFNIKFDNYGQQLWNTTWKVTGDCKQTSGLAVDSKQNIYNLVNFYSLEDTSLILKINSSGKSVWNKTFAGYFNSIYLDKHDNIYLSGYSWDWKRDERHIILKKFSSDGISQWNHSFIMEDIIYLSGSPCTMMVDHLNQTYVAGMIMTSGFQNGIEYSNAFGSYNAAPIIYTCVYNSSGHLLSIDWWNMQYNYISTTMTFDTSCNLYLMGTDKEITQNIIFKYDSLWDLNLTIDNWQNNAIVGMSDVWESISIDQSKNIYCGGTNSYFSGREIYLVKFNSSGQVKFDGAWNNLSEAYFIDFYVDSNTNIYITGLSGIGPYNCRAIILKNPVLGEFSNPPQPLNIGLILTTTSIIFVCGMVGIYFYIQYKRRSL